ncbi:MAG: type IV pilin protein [Bacteroidota bacterium]
MKTISRCCTTSSSQKGFTLVELMIVVAIIGILSAIAYPNYMEYVRSSARADAKAALMENAQYLERYQTTSNKYDVAAGVISSVSPKGASGSAVRYNITLAVPGATTYTLTATPTGAQAVDRCGTLTLTANGTRSPTTSGCW